MIKAKYMKSSPGRSPGSGEKLERRRRQTFTALTIAVGLLGGLVGFLMAHRYPDVVLDGPSTWSPSFAIFAAMIVGGIACAGRFFVMPRLDEVEKQRELRIWSVGAQTYFIGYPLWFLLWKGGLLAQPAHGTIFIAFVLSMVLAAAYERYR